MSWLRIQLWFLVLALAGFGLVMVASTTAALGRGGDGGANLHHVTIQALAMGCGLIGAFALSAIGVARLRANWLVALVVAAAVGALVMVLLTGRSINGARRWIDLGPVNLQPAELAKFALVIAAAWWFARCAESVRSITHGVILPLIGFAVLAGLVFATKDLGSVVVMFVLLGVLIAWAGASWLYFLGLTILIAPMGFYYSVYKESYRWERITAFIDPFNASGPAGYHLVQSYLTIAGGNVSGTGLGGSAAGCRLPERHTDFIYAVICNEFGMVGGLIVAGVYLALVVTGLLIAMRARDLHGRLLAVGVTAMLGTQAFWNMLVATGAVPTKGLTLPFISYGGTSAAICIALIGLLDAVARDQVREVRDRPMTRIGATVRSSATLRRLRPVTEASNA